MQNTHEFAPMPRALEVEVQATCPYVCEWNHINKVKLTSAVFEASSPRVGSNIHFAITELRKPKLMAASSTDARNSTEGGSSELVELVGWVLRVGPIIENLQQNKKRVAKGR